MGLVHNIDEYPKLDNLFVYTHKVNDINAKTVLQPDCLRRSLLLLLFAFTLRITIFSSSRLRSNFCSFISNVSILLQLLQKSLMSSIDLGLEIEGTSIARIVGLKVFIKLLPISYIPLMIILTSERVVEFTSSLLRSRICRDSGIEMPLRRLKSWAGA